MDISSCTSDSLPMNGNNRKKVSRSNKKNEVAPMAPVFLRKTYELINTCDPEVATWSVDGMTFVVKDPKRFQFEFIPKYFKHNNFSSFVRQLNFYGFHKVKSDPLQLDDADFSEESKYWKFHHENFMRGRPELLNEIRKSNRTEAAEKQEVDALRHEIMTLNDHILSLKRDLESMKTLVGGILQGQSSSPPQQVFVAETPTKKAKYSHDVSSSMITPDNSFGSPNQCEIQMMSKNVIPAHEVDASDDEFSNMQKNYGGLSHMTAPSFHHTTSLGGMSLGTTGFQDENYMFSSLFALDPLDEISVLLEGNAGL
jgi:hypothetical protein